MSDMTYDPKILSPEHAMFCWAEAERRYTGKMVRDEYNMLMVQDMDGVEHTDAVLRALSNYQPPGSAPRRSRPVMPPKSWLPKRAKKQE
jgi:hypothetical protein